jgi:hypothetical protein
MYPYPNFSALVVLARANLKPGPDATAVFLFLAEATKRDPDSTTDIVVAQVLQRSIMQGHFESYAKAKRALQMVITRVPAISGSIV